MSMTARDDADDDDDDDDGLTPSVSLCPRYFSVSGDEDDDDELPLVLLFPSWSINFARDERFFPFFYFSMSLIFLLCFLLHLHSS